MSPELAEKPIVETYNETSSKKEVVNKTIITLNPDFEAIKDLCVDKPLYQYEEMTDEDIEDIQEALDSLKESDRMSLDDFEKELDL